MSTQIQTEPTINKPQAVSNEDVRKATDVAKDMAEEAININKNTAQRASDSVKDMYQSAAVKAEETLETSKEYVRRNPVPTVLGAIAFGAALGYMLQAALRKQTFRERYEDEPMGAVRDAILGALAPVTQRVHDGYDSARDGAGKAIDRLHRIGTGRNGKSISDRAGRIAHNLKFW